MATYCTCANKDIKPWPSKTSKGYFCGTCKKEIQLTETYNTEPNYYITGGENIPDTRKEFEYECPICEHLMLFFKEIRNPIGEAQCRLCGSIVKAETVQAIIDERAKDWEEKKNNRMLRILSYMGNGIIGRHEEPEG